MSNKTTPEQYELMLDYYNDNPDIGRTELSRRTGLGEKRCRTFLRMMRSSMDTKLTTENNKSQKSLQRLMDSNRILRKTNREEFRVANAIEEYTKNLHEIFKNNPLSQCNIVDRENNTESCGIVHVSDIHFNELISLPNNKYDFNIASARLKHLADKATQYFSAMGISNVLVAFTGDLMNSDRRIDELLNQATNRSKATFLAVDILQQFLLQLASRFNVSTTYVTGNESRVKEDWGWSDNIASDNYDFTIFNILKVAFRESHLPISFIDPHKQTETVVSVAGQNVLLIHGNGSISAKVEQSVNQIMGRYSNKGVPISYVILGHLHSARIGDLYARSSSVAGSNDYSEQGLNLSSRASQNLYLFYSDGNRDGIKVDLQNVNTDNRYNIDKTLAEYNAKSHDKLHKTQTIFKVVV